MSKSAEKDQGYKPPPGSALNPVASKVRSATEEAKEENVDLKWWLKEGDDQAQAITNTLFNIRLYQVQRFNQMNLSTRLYGNRGLSQMFSVGKSGTMRMVKLAQLPPDRLQNNIVSSCVDTIHSKMVKNKPMPMFLTSGGTYKDQRKARKLTRFCEAVFHEGKVHQKGAAAFRSALVVGDGFIYVYKHPETKRVAFDVVPAEEILVDEIEASHGEPRQLHRARNADRGVLMAMDCFKSDDCQQKLHDADMISGDSGTTPLQVSDTIEIRESWHLPSSPEAKDGKHVLSCSAGILYEEPYEEDYFPFAKFSWSRPTSLGYYGTGAVQQIQGQQVEVNKLLWLESMSIQMMGSFKVAIPMGSQVVPEAVNNGLGLQIKFAGDKAPTYLTPQAFHEQVPQMIKDVTASAYEQLGVSMLSAQSKKPEGLDSGTAIREYNYIETDRFYSKGAEYEQFYMDIADLAIRVTKKIFEEEGSYKVKHFGSEMRYISELDWAELDVDLDDYTIQCFPVSSLPNEPAGRFQKVQEYVQAGWMTPARGRRLLAYPDIEKDDNLANASEEYIAKIIDKMVDGTSKDPRDDYTPPDPLDNLDQAHEMAVQEYNLARCGDLEEERLNLLRTFIEQISDLKQAAAAASAPPGGPGAGVPQGAPQPPPTSDLMPQGSGGQPPAAPPPQ